VSARRSGFSGEKTSFSDFGEMGIPLAFASDRPEAIEVALYAISKCRAEPRPRSQCPGDVLLRHAATDLAVLWGEVAQSIAAYAVDQVHNRALAEM